MSVDYEDSLSSSKRVPPLMNGLGGNISDNDQGGKQLPNIARTEVRLRD